MRVEGSDYIVKDGDVFHFRFNVWLELNYEWDYRSYSKR
jgi:hypothetical protein